MISFDELIFDNILRSVSYTHLDVYKRQTLGSEIVMLYNEKKVPLLFFSRDTVIALNQQESMDIMVEALAWVPQCPKHPPLPFWVNLIPENLPFLTDWRGQGNESEIGPEKRLRKKKDTMLSLIHI